jgi:2-aminoadipate transaminase
VLYVGSFSKIMAPGVRTGWVVAPEAVVQRLSILKQGSDLDVCSFAQRALAEMLADEPVDAHLERLRSEYGARRDAMLAALAEHFPPGARWHRPPSGMYVWVELPAQADTTALLRRAVDEAGVAFVPGRAFCAAGGVRGGNGMRLNFSRVAPLEIHEGIRRLGGVLRPRGAAVALAAPPAPAPSGAAAE